MTHPISALNPCLPLRPVAHTVRSYTRASTLPAIADRPVAPAAPIPTPVSSGDGAPHVTRSGYAAVGAHPVRDQRLPLRPVAHKVRSYMITLVLMVIAMPAFADEPVTLSSASTAAEANLVDIRTLVPDIHEDIKYAGHDNFVGRPVDGYAAPKCLLLKPVAEALARVEHDLRREHARLRIWDCYRPARAVADFVRWAHDLSDQTTKATHYPNLDKSKLLGDYIAPVSGHSRGATADLTMEQCDAHDRHCQPLDMGTPFDWFGLRANTDNPGVTAEQRTNRQRLLRAMAREGFKNYPMEWWHHTLQPEPTPHTMYDAPIR